MRDNGVRLVGAVFVVAALVGARTLARGVEQFTGRSSTVYPWWTWALALAVAVGGAALLLAPRRAVRVAASAGLVAGAQLAGTGVVAARHWRPAMGTGAVRNDIGQLDVLVPLALQLAAAGAAVSLLACVLLLRRGRDGEPLPRSRRLTLVGLAALVVLVVPVLAVGAYPDLTSWGAAGLVTSGPWAAALVAAALLPATVSRALTVCVVASAVVVAAEPQTALLGFDARLAWVVGALLALAGAAAARTPAPGGALRAQA